MSFSSASSKVNKGPREEGQDEENKERQERPKRDYNNRDRDNNNDRREQRAAPVKQVPAFEDDGDFQVVTDKKRRI